MREKWDACALPGRGQNFYRHTNMQHRFYTWQRGPNAFKPSSIHPKVMEYVEETYSKRNALKMALQHGSDRTLYNFGYFNLGRKSASCCLWLTAG